MAHGLDKLIHELNTILNTSPIIPCKLYLSSHAFLSFPSTFMQAGLPQAQNELPPTHTHVWTNKLTVAHLRLLSFSSLSPCIQAVQGRLTPGIKSFAHKPTYGPCIQTHSTTNFKAYAFSREAYPRHTRSPLPPHIYMDLQTHFSY